jgi:hypothetical protein
LPIRQVSQRAHVANGLGVQLIVPLSLPFSPFDLFLLFSSALSLSALEFARTLRSHLFLFLDSFLGGPELEGTGHDCDHADEEGGFAQVVELGLFLLLFSASGFARASAAG